jgi:hypothetical protein
MSPGKLFSGICGVHVLFRDGVRHLGPAGHDGAAQAVHCGPDGPSNVEGGAVFWCFMRGMSGILTI